MVRFVAAAGWQETGARHDTVCALWHTAYGMDGRVRVCVHIYD